MERKFNFSVEEFYHLYNRGNNKSNIFIDDTDRKRFQKLLYICNTTERVVFRDVQKLSLEKIKREDTLVDIGAKGRRYQFVRRKTPHCLFYVF
jgi:hypothetical protein